MNITSRLKIRNVFCLFYCVFRSLELALGFFAVGLFAVGQFVVKKEKDLTEPNLTNLIWPNLTETKIIFDGKVSHGEKSGHA